MTYSISFFTPVCFGEQKTFKQHFQERVDDYFYLGGKSVFVISGKVSGDSQGVSIRDQDQSRVKQLILGVIKVISYMTVIIPLIMLIAKASFRLTHKFHIVLQDKILIKNYFLITEKASLLSYLLSSYNESINDSQWNNPQELTFLIGEFQEIEISLVSLLNKVKSEYKEYPQEKNELETLIFRLMKQTSKSLKALKGKIQDKIPRGLKNVGNTCYMNSALQPLLAIGNFEQIIPDSVAPEPKHSFEKRTKVLASFKDFFEAWKNKETVENLGRKVGALRREIFEAGLLEGGFIDRAQEKSFQDAGQFFELILHVLGKGFQLEMTRTPIKDDGESIEASRKVEITPEGVFYLKSPGNLLQKIVNGHKEVLDQKLTPGDEWRVEVKDPNSQSKMSEIFISRYKEMQKIIGSAPEILVVRVNNHVVKPEQDQMIDFTPLFKEPSGNCNYQLVGFSQNHYQVHWTSVVRKENSWHHCNDGQIQLISTESDSFKHPANYMIFQKQAN